MSSSAGVETGLSRFVRRLLSLHGAAVQSRTSGFEVLVPGELARKLGVSEYCFLSVGPGEPGDSLDAARYQVAFGSPLLDRMLHEACGQVPVLDCALRFNYMKTGGFDSLVQRIFTFQGAVVEAKSWAEVQTEYLMLTCRYLAQSDEQKQGTIRVTLNLETGAPIDDMAEAMVALEKTFGAGGRPLGLDQPRIEKIVRWVELRSRSILADVIGPFQESMNRRFRRDVKNLRDYYAALKKEMEESLKRPGLSEQLISDRQEKIALLPEEVRQKSDDLFKKYSIHVTLALSGGIWIRTPAVKVLTTLSVGRTRKNLSLLYNPVNKTLDPLVCNGCGEGTYSVAFCCNLHLLCPSCSRACPVCGK